ncbi:hypothetical protein HZS_5978, partial [Henneguya salminicola]
MEAEGNVFKKAETKPDAIASAITNIAFIQDQLYKYSVEQQTQIINLKQQNKKLKDEIDNLDIKFHTTDISIDIKNVENEYLCWINSQFRSVKKFNPSAENYEKILSNFLHQIKNRLKPNKNSDLSEILDKYLMFNDKTIFNYNHLKFHEPLSASDIENLILSFEASS